MGLLTIIYPGLKVLFERLGKPEVVNLVDELRPGRPGAVIACNHIGWADSLWIAYAVYPRQLRYLSKKELFDSRTLRWVLEHGGSLPLDRTAPAPGSIKAAVALLKNGDILLIFPSGTRSAESSEFKRGAATVALHAGVPLVPAFYQGPPNMQVGHLTNRPRIRVTFGTPIPTTGLPIVRETAIELTRQIESAIGRLRSLANAELSAA